MTTPAAQSPTNLDLYWRFILPKPRGKLYLHTLPLDPTYDGSAVMKRLHEEYDQVKSLPPYRFWDGAWVFWKPVVEIALLSENTSDVESQPTTPHRVFISGRTPSAELTAAFHDPAIFSGVHTFIQRHSQFAVNTKTNPVGRQALLIGLEASLFYNLSLLLFGLGVCFGSGVLVGFLTKRVDLGVAVSSGLGSIIACVEVFLFWVWR